jgi:hypothetical protein
MNEFKLKVKRKNEKVTELYHQKYKKQQRTRYNRRIIIYNHGLYLQFQINLKKKLNKIINQQNFYKIMKEIISNKSKLLFFYQKK